MPVLRCRFLCEPPLALMRMNAGFDGAGCAPMLFADLAAILY
jgi:hypothetical protein